MFIGFKSRWTMPLPCADSSASAIWMPKSSSGPISIGAAAIRTESGSPSTSSITMNDCPSSCSMACTVQMPGWFRAEAARASRSNRSSIGASCASCAERNFTATLRRSRVSSASYTTPMPPAPSSRRIR